MKVSQKKEKQTYALRISNGKEKGIVGDMYFVSSHPISLPFFGGMTGRKHHTTRLEYEPPYSKPKLYSSKKRAETIAKKYNEYNFDMYKYEVVPLSY